jgi:hypothetical protein
LLVESSIVKPEKLKPLMDECEELTAMFVVMVKNVKNRK